ncbi:SAM-dependent methyltransferase [Lentzea jiangxiensis]|uniref:Methyltransferase domain-containing protein n=1 Tax=Lentzea jiangxiensis TaxID=641025 RepID=A0A1H0SL35_9PSEU|nr:class I SAM-dependent methyltransferase [Lentzea jiangxiensis]SDP42454.1 Methyltransferase domain-containing protein [Lentzea jiangxiensis]
MSDFDDLNAQLWILGAIGRLADQGLLERAADPDDELSALSQQLLIDTGWLLTDPLRPSARLLDAPPPGVAVSALSGYVREQLARVGRFTEGAPAGWNELDRDRIRWRGRASGVIAHGIIERCCPDVLQRAERFLDVGTGAGGIAMRLCRTLPALRAVGLEISPAALDVARIDVVAAGLDDRIEIRDQSVSDLTDVEEYDLAWLPQQFIPRAQLLEGLPRVFRSLRPDGALVMALASESDLPNLVTGGGTLSAEEAVKLVEQAGFRHVQTHGQVVSGRR